MFMPMDGFGGFDTIFSIIFVIMFIVVVGGILWVLLMGIKEWNKNNHSPLLTVNATVVSKRKDINMDTSKDGFSSSTTWYYVTFQVESGDRMEFSISGKEYGILVEGDNGKLTFQGTRYLNFERYN